MNKPIDKLSSPTTSHVPTHQKRISKKIPLQVKVESPHESRKVEKVIQAIKSPKAAHDKITETVSHHINIQLHVRPIDLWKTYPTINLVEIRHMLEIDQLKEDLTRILESKRPNAPHFTEYDLSPFGLSKKVQVIGNVYVPIKRSEHLDIQSTLLRASPQLGIKNSQAITFIIVEDELWDAVIPELHQHSATVLALPTPGHEPATELKEEKTQSPGSSRHKRAKHSAILNFTPKMHTMVVKVLLAIIAQEFYSKEKAEKRKEKELQKEEKCIKFAIRQYERLQKLVLNEAKKRELSSHDFDAIVKNWEDSCPPFPIRTSKNSVLWRELKSKMIEGFKSV